MIDHLLYECHNMTGEGAAVIVQPHARIKNVFTENQQALVAKAPIVNGDYLNERLLAALNLLGGVEKAIKSGDQVMLKPNFNCSFATPLSTDPGILAAVIETLKDTGAKVVIGEMSGRADGPTRKVVKNLGIDRLLKFYGVPLIMFEEDQWVELEVPGKYWKSYHVPRSIYEADKRVYLSNMRCHSSARFSVSLKLGVGWLSAEDREIMHSDRNTTESMVAELHLGWQPNLIIVDGRRSTVNWHGRGPYVFPNVIMASGDLVAIDSEAVKLLKQFPAENRIGVPLEELDQLRVAAAHGLGSMHYILKEAEAHLETEQKNNLDPAAIPLSEDEKKQNQS
jgi:uncharacterized protein (DUF362 family)